MSLLKAIVALPVIVMMVVLAKVAQYAAVDAFGAALGFDLASAVGVVPVIVLYYWAAVSLPRLTIWGLTRG